MKSEPFLFQPLQLLLDGLQSLFSSLQTQYARRAKYTNIDTVIANRSFDIDCMLREVSLVTVHLTYSTYQVGSVDVCI
jgi:hypothetical protein